MRSMHRVSKYRNIILGVVMTLLLILSSFFVLYRGYIQNRVYHERLNQMSEVTHQMFRSLEDVIDAQWGHVDAQCNYVLDAHPTTLDALQRYMEHSSRLAEEETKKITLMAVDAKGHYYTKNGSVGLLRDLEYFEEAPERISFVANSLTTNRSQMVFLKKLSTPLVLESGDEEIRITYYGMFQDMEQLIGYFDCDAYENHNSVYVLDNHGFKLFNSNRTELIKGHNVFNVLEKMKYLHGSSFEKTKAALAETGVAYSNAVFDGTEYYYALKRLDNAEWTLIFLVPAAYVATNTVALVNSIIVFIVVFSLVAAAFAIGSIVYLMNKAQTETLRVERENNLKLESVNAELRRAKQAADEAFQVAQEANRSKSSFLANMSHDIRTPMNAIVGMTTLIQHDCGDAAKVQEYAAKIELSSKHLLGIINDVLDMSKIESGKTVLKYADFSMFDLIQEMDSVFRSQAAKKQQSFRIRQLHIRHEWVNGDQVHLMQVFSNLLSNAVKYTGEGGNIEFTIEECPTMSTTLAKFHFQVKDNGMGMSAEYQKKIFDTFTREENSLTNKIQGTGLGMAITKNLVDAMGGTIDVHSEKGKGSCFDLLLDLKIAEHQTDPQTADAQSAVTDAPVLQGKRFLCAEDNALNAEILTELLKIEGARCTICENGKEIVDAFMQSAVGDYDMILMDVQMPVMNGYEATRAIRESHHPLAQTIPIIAMTANAFSDDIQASFNAGMNGHVSKPVEMSVLEKAIRSIDKH